MAYRVSITMVVLISDCRRKRACAAAAAASVSNRVQVAVVAEALCGTKPEAKPGARFWWC